MPTVSTWVRTTAASEIARDLLGPGRIIGKSTHNLEEALQAEQDGADYIGFGAMYPDRQQERYPYRRHRRTGRHP